MAQYLGAIYTRPLTINGVGYILTRRTNQPDAGWQPGPPGILHPPEGRADCRVMAGPQALTESISLAEEGAVHSVIAPMCSEKDPLNRHHRHHRVHDVRHILADQADAEPHTELLERLMRRRRTDDSQAGGGLQASRVAQRLRAMNHGRDRDMRQQGTAMLDMLMTRATSRLGPY